MRAAVRVCLHPLSLLCVSLSLSLLWEKHFGNTQNYANSEARFTNILICILRPHCLPQFVAHIEARIGVTSYKYFLDSRPQSAVPQFHSFLFPPLAAHFIMQGTQSQRPSYAFSHVIFLCVHSPTAQPVSQSVSQAVCQSVWQSTMVWLINALYIKGLTLSRGRSWEWECGRCCVKYGSCLLSAAVEPL